MINVIKILIFLTLVCFSRTYAASIEAVSKPEGYVMKIKGDIVKGDYNSIVSVLKSKKKFPIIFDISSPGGDVVEAIKIGHLLRDSLSNIMATKICNSACFIIYSGASFNKVPLVKIGIHRPKYDDSYFSGLTYVEAQNKYKELDTLVRNYLKEMYVDTTLIEDMFSTSSSSVKLIPPSEMTKLVPQTSPVTQEWLASNCETLTDKESSDYNYIFNPIIKRESNNFSKGYLSYLQNKNKGFHECASDFIAKTQQEIIKSL